MENSQRLVVIKNGFMNQVEIKKQHLNPRFRFTPDWGWMDTGEIYVPKAMLSGLIAVLQKIAAAPEEVANEEIINETLPTD